MQNETKPSREELKRRLRMKLQGTRIQRMNKVTKENHINQMKETVLENLGATPEQLVNLTSNNDIGLQTLSAKDRKKQQKREKKKMKDLAKKLGEISKKDYDIAMERIKKDNYNKPEERFRDFNVVKLYKIQRKETEKNIKEISETEADQLLLGDLDCMRLDDGMSLDECQDDDSSEESSSLS